MKPPPRTDHVGPHSGPSLNKVQVEGILTGQCYCDESFRPLLLQYAGALCNVSFLTTQCQALCMQNCQRISAVLEHRVSPTGYCVM